MFGVCVFVGTIFLPVLNSANEPKKFLQQNFKPAETMWSCWWLLFQEGLSSVWEMHVAGRASVVSQVVADSNE